MSQLDRFRPNTLPTALPKTDGMDRNGGIMQITKVMTTDMRSVDQSHDANCKIVDVILLPQEREQQRDLK